MLTVTEQARLHLWDWARARAGDDQPLQRADDGKPYTADDAVDGVPSRKVGA
jgi:hypothetical protein